MFSFNGNNRNNHEIMHDFSFNGNNKNNHERMRDCFSFNKNNRNNHERMRDCFHLIKIIEITMKGGALISAHIVRFTLNRMN